MTVDRLTDVNDLLNTLTADMDHFFQILRTFFGTLGPAFWSFDQQLVVEGSTGAPKGTAWAPGLDFK